MLSSHNLERELIAIRATFEDDDRPPTEPQIHLLRMLMEKGLTDKRRKVRLHILRRITGLPELESSKHLTLGVVSGLIFYFKSGPDGVYNLDQSAEKLLFALETEAIGTIGLPRPRKKKEETMATPW